MPKGRWIGLWLAVVGMALAVQSCREDEQDRPLLYDKGSYQGQPDQTLSEQQVDRLRQRSAGQEF
jgi:hypothetical protein